MQENLDLNTKSFESIFSSYPKALVSNIYDNNNNNNSNEKKKQK